MHPRTINVIISNLFVQFLRGEPSMILKFPDFSLTFEDFLISMTILQNSLTFPWPWRKTKFPWLFHDHWAPCNSYCCIWYWFLNQSNTSTMAEKAHFIQLKARKSYFNVEIEKQLLGNSKVWQCRNYFTIICTHSWAKTIDIELKFK